MRTSRVFPRLRRGGARRGWAPLLAALILAVGGALQAAGDEYADIIRPIIESKCYPCHNPENQKSELCLAARETMLKGGKSGTPAVVPGDATASMLVKRITLAPEDERVMPPKDKPRLEPAEILALIHWINRGAQWAAAQPEAPATPEVTLAGAIDFATQIWPIFETKCVSCHGPEKQKAKLRLDSAEAILAGARGEPVLIAGNPVESKLLQLISLPPDDPDIMPAEGEPLTQEQIALIRQWIEQGLNFGGWTAPQPLIAAAPEAPGRAPVDLAALAEGVAPAPEEALDALRKLGALAAPLDAKTPLIRVEFQLTSEEIGDDKLALLEPVREQLTWLNLAGTKVSDAGLAQIEGLGRLTKLHLERTGVTDAGLAHLKNLPNLEYLNLYATNVSDAGLENLKGLPRLKKLYLWQSKATQTGADALQAAIPGLDVNLGTELAAVKPQIDPALKKLSYFFAADSCCAKAFADGKACDHPCCAEASSKGEPCLKCNAGSDIKVKLAALFDAESCCGKALLEGKACDHPCCVEAAAKGEPCLKCNPGAEAKLTAAAPAPAEAAPAEAPAAEAPAVLPSVAFFFTAGSCCATALAEGKVCGHPCCMEAAAKCEPCLKCNTGAAAKRVLTQQFTPGSCCSKALEEGKWCEHPCCKEAFTKIEVCPKCNAKPAGDKAAEARVAAPVSGASGGATVAFAVASADAPEPKPARTLSFNRHIRPILAENCYKCHGPDKNARKANLRLDVREEAIADRDGVRPIVPGASASSELLRRVTSHDPSTVMPPPETEKKLTEKQIATLTQWIDEGAEYEPHWAYLPPRKLEPPPEADESWANNPIDHFTFAAMRQQGLEPSREADRRTLIRRLSMDLTGLPPTPEEVDAFVNDPSHAAYERLVDRLLASPHYGERMAIDWLDQVRYADTNGFHGDEYRSVWPYRDYVIHAFNENMPYDQFTIEQLAGDLLPNATRDQLVAAAYNRLNQITAEGGAQEGEYIAMYAADRVRTASSVWMGATMGCAQCHDHKYDPYTMKDFYSMAAFFADIEEKGVYSAGDKWEPILRLPAQEHTAKLAGYDERIAALQRALDTPTDELAASQRKWEEVLRTQGQLVFGTWQSLGPFGPDFFDTLYDTDYGPETRIDLAQTFNSGALKWEARPDWKDGEIWTLHGGVSATYVYRAIDAPAPRPLTISLGSNDALKAWLNGKVVLDQRIQRSAQPDQDQVTLELEAGMNHLLFKIVNAGAKHEFYFKALDEGTPADIIEIVNAPEEQRTDEQRGKLAAYYRSIAPELAETRAALETTKKERAEFDANIPYILLTHSVEPRVVRILPRGNWMDESGPVVEPAVPGFLSGLHVEGRRATRLDLANWLVSRDNPLTARVFVNRLWKQLFGTGLSRVLDDLGAQGEWPTHPDLLDWLAVEFMDSGWDVKHMVKLIAMSATYRQTSDATPEAAGRDPYNRWLARQSRFRYEAEIVRDNALAISGLLARRIGGRSVYPYQAGGYYDNCNTFTGPLIYTPDEGENQYRRGLYTFWKRSFLHPSMMAFDAPNREECTADRTLSNTPLQALALLNDPTYVEAARAFAERIIREGGDSARDRIEYAFRRALSRSPRTEEIETLSRLCGKHMREYQEKKDEAKALLTVGFSPAPADVDAAELAAWTSVARVILNLHETITRS